MTTTLAQTQSAWVTSSHVALSAMEAAASQPVRRVRSLEALRGTNCHTVYARSPR